MLSVETQDWEALEGIWYVSMETYSYMSKMLLWENRQPEIFNSNMH